MEAKVEAVLSYPAPTTRQELKRFLGLTGYYRCFCKNFAVVVAPLTRLCSPKIPFQWSGECQHAFEAAKSLLCSAPVLAAPNFSQPFKLEVDASATGAGAVLLQDDAEGVCHPVCYYSVKFKRHQLNYSTIEKEALALLMALQHFMWGRNRCADIRIIIVKLTLMTLVLFVSPFCHQVLQICNTTFRLRKNHVTSDWLKDRTRAAQWCIG